MSKLIATHQTTGCKITVVTGTSWLWCLLFGPFYYWSKGMIVWGFISLITANGLYILMPMFNRRIIKSHLEQSGQWKVRQK